MSIVHQVSSRMGDRTERSNLKVAYECVMNPELLHDIAAALSDRDGKLAGDCAEVMTKVAEEKPELVIPYISHIAALLERKTNRVRWEAVHALALVAEYGKEEIGPLLIAIRQLIQDDQSIIVRDYAVDVAANYAKIGPGEAEAAYPILREALYVWEGRHAGHALDGLLHVAQQCPYRAGEILSLGYEFVNHGKGVIQKAAKSLIKTVGKI